MLGDGERLRYWEKVKADCAVKISHDRKIIVVNSLWWDRRLTKKKSLIDKTHDHPNGKSKPTIISSSIINVRLH